VSLASELLKDVPKASERYNECIKLISSGEELSKALRITDALPSSQCRMLEIGFKCGKSDMVIDEISEKLTDDAIHGIEDKLSGIEPAIVLVSSVLVGIILLSVMLPLMHIMSAIG